MFFLARTDRQTDRHATRTNTHTDASKTVHSFIHIRLIEKVVRTQLNIRKQHKTSIRQSENGCQATTV